MIKIIFIIITLSFSLTLFAQENEGDETPVIPELKPLSSLQKKIIDPLKDMIPVDQIDGTQFNTFLKTTINGLLHSFPGLLSEPQQTSALGKSWTSYRLEGESLKNLSQFLSFFPDAKGDGIQFAQYLLTQLNLLEYKYSTDEKQILLVFHFKRKLTGRSKLLSDATHSLFTGLEFDLKTQVLINFINQDKISLSSRGFTILGTAIHKVTLPELFINHVENNMSLLENNFILLNNL